MEEDYPRNLLEFEERFSFEARCIEYLKALRWPGGFICPHCGETTAWGTNGSITRLLTKIDG